MFAAFAPEKNAAGNAAGQMVTDIHPWTGVRILYLVHRTPYPPNRGHRIRSFHLLDYLAARAEVHLAFLAEATPSEETMAELQRRCARVAAVPVERRRRWLRAASRFAAGGTLTEGLFASPRLQRLVRRWTDETRFDAVVVFCSSMVQYLDMPGLDGVPAVVDLVDVDSQKWFDYADHARGLKRWGFGLEGRRLRQLEQALPEVAQAITLVSQPEVELFRRFCPAGGVHAIGNGVDLDYFDPSRFGGEEKPPTCVFVGALDYRANVDGITWFAERVWPVVRRQRPEARLVLVGSNPGRAIRRVAEASGVELVGEVPDVRPYLAGATASVVPLRVARGVQNKVLESLAMGKAVIASPQSLEGLDLEPGVHVYRAASEQAWAEGLLDLLDHPDLRARLGRAGRAQVERRYGWPAQLEPLGALLGLIQQNAECRMQNAE